MKPDREYRGRYLDEASKLCLNEATLASLGARQIQIECDPEGFYRRLGLGRFGSVYAARKINRDSRPSRQVAVKVMHLFQTHEGSKHRILDTPLSNEDIRDRWARFNNERHTCCEISEASNLFNAELKAALPMWVDDDIPKLQDISAPTYLDGVNPWIAMTRVPGEPLLEMIGRISQFPLVKRVTFLRDLAIFVDQLHTLHAHQNRNEGVLHRDISPNNILVSVQSVENEEYRQKDDPDARIVPGLIDFGLSRTEGVNSIDQNLTGFTGRRPIGTPGYAAPELASNERIHTGTRATDTYSVCASGYFLFTSEHPPDSLIDQDEARARIEEGWKHSDITDLNLREIINNGLGRDYNRHQNAGMLASHLDDWLKDQALAPQRRAENTARKARHHKYFALLATVIILLLVAVTGLIWWNHIETRRGVDRQHLIQDLRQINERIDQTNWLQPEMAGIYKAITDDRDAFYLTIDNDDLDSARGIRDKLQQDIYDALKQNDAARAALQERKLIQEELSQYSDRLQALIDKHEPYTLLRDQADSAYSLAGDWENAFQLSKLSREKAMVFLEKHETDDERHQRISQDPAVIESITQEFEETINNLREDNKNTAEELAKKEGELIAAKTQNEKYVESIVESRLQKIDSGRQQVEPLPRKSESLPSADRDQTPKHITQVPVTVQDPAAPNLVGDEIINSLGMKLTYIPPGSFVMGSPRTEKGRVHTETQHTVKISRGFMMGVTEVRRKDFAAFIKATGYKVKGDGWGGSAATRFHTSSNYNWQHTGYPYRDDHPVVNVSWHDAMAFCLWLTKKEGRQYRLPTEAEWEYACRAGSKTALPWGENLLDGVRFANIADQAGKGLHHGFSLSFAPYNDGHAFSAKVSSYGANEWGLYDMIGNVEEWCSDWYDSDYPKGFVTDPIGPRRGTVRVLRGGSWIDGPDDCRSATRSSTTPSNLWSFVGFRICATLD